MNAPTCNAKACGNCLYMKKSMGSGPTCLRWQQDVEILMSCSAFLPYELSVLLPIVHKVTLEELRSLIRPVVNINYGTLDREEAEINTWRDSLRSFPGNLSMSKA